MGWAKMGGISKVALAFASMAWATTAEAHHKGEVALTFDDLPALTILRDQPYVNYLNEALLRGLRRHHMPAIGFVNEGKLDQIDRAQQIAVLREWLKAGMDLGNHTFSHESPNSIGADAYVADIAKGETVTKRLLARQGRSLRWFRYPYLETGATPEIKSRIEAWLAAHHYRIAPVTLDASDWMFAEPYDKAISLHDEKQRLRIKAEYLDYTDRMIDWHESAGKALFGRQIALVMLLHASRLNADCIDDIASLLRRRKLRAVTLGKAMKDPAYRTRDTYVGADGIGWLDRWAMALHVSLPSSDSLDPPEDIEAEYDRVDNDREVHP